LNHAPKVGKKYPKILSNTLKISTLKLGLYHKIPYIEREGRERRERE